MVHDNQHSGWIRLYRQSLGSQVWQDPHLWQLWCYCLMQANHKPTWFSVTTGRGQTQVRLEPGQFIFGRFSAAKKLKAKPTTTYARLKKLEKAENIVTQNMVHYTLVTVCNWEKYQGSNDANDTQLTPNRHPNDTDKNDKNGKKYNRNSDEFRLATLLFDEIRSRKPDFKEPNVSTWARHIDMMMRCDHRQLVRIEQVIHWCQADDFWQNNILSTAKLRKQFDKLELAMSKRCGPAPEPVQRGPDGLTPRERIKASFEREAVAV